MIKKLLLSLTATLLLVPHIAYGLSLGEAELRSALNQRLDARIPLADGADLDGLKIGLADSVAFQRAGLHRSHLHSQLRFTLVSTEPGTGYIRVTSKDAIREPFLTFVLEVDGPNGRLHREYALLFEVPGY